MASTIGLSSLFSSQPPPPSQPVTPSIPIRRLRTRSLSPSPSPLRNATPSSPYEYGQDHTEVIPPIPPSTNPRGELIFSSRVHPSFREGYERYRESYERKRSQGAPRTNGAATSDNVAKRMLYRIRHPFGGGVTPPSVYDTPRAMTPVLTPGGVDTPTAEGAAFGGLGGSPGSMRGRTNSNTPTGSRRSSPAPPGSLGKKGSKRRPGGKLSRQSTPLLEIVEVLGASGGPGMNATSETGFASTSGATPLTRVRSSKCRVWVSTVGRLDD
ncbi:13900_t:CDS:2, partial [Acaulospora colombiana]